MRTLNNLCAVWAIAAWSALAAVASVEVSGTVVRVTDGDTVIVEDVLNRREKVRIISIDAPEKGRRGEPGQPYSERSRQHLENLVSGKIVRLSLRGRDDYGRILARIWIEDLDVGLAQVCAGHAWVFDAFLHELPVADQETYLACESKARQEDRGLWRGSQPVPPWQWRYSRRDAN